MEQTYKNFLIAFLLLNAIFWSMASHQTHCELISKVGITQCPPHWIHVYVIGLGSFLIAIYLIQGNAGFKLD